MTIKAWALRTAWLGIAALLLPACSDAPSAAILFSDNFNSTFPSAAWTVTGTATVVRDVLNGHKDTTSLRASTTSAGPSVAVETTTTFNSASLTFSVHMAANEAQSTDEGVGTITIRDSLDAAVASASWDELTGNLTLTIEGVLTNIIVAAPAADLSFHRLVFSLSGGTGRWTLDNGATLMTGTPTFTGPLTLELGASYPGGTTWALFYFDNVHVTSP